MPVEPASALGRTPVCPLLSCLGAFPLHRHRPRWIFQNQLSWCVLRSLHCVAYRTRWRLLCICLSQALAPAQWSLPVPAPSVPCTPSPFSYAQLPPPPHWSPAPRVSHFCSFISSQLKAAFHSNLTIPEHQFSLHTLLCIC